MAYDAQGNQKVLEGILEAAKVYERDFPKMWDFYDNVPEAANGLPLISHMKNPDDSPKGTTYVEIRREKDGSLNFYDYFDGEAKVSSPERVAEKLGQENATGWMNPETYTPGYLIDKFSTVVKAGAEIFVETRILKPLDEYLK